MATSKQQTPPAEQTEEQPEDLDALRARLAELEAQLAAAPQASAEAEAAPAEREYIVEHTLVGDWPKGTILRETQLAGIDIKRLKDIGAIKRHRVAPADED